MTRKLIVTGDGSPSFSVDGGRVTYHSTFGALQESRHIFINAGLVPALEKFDEVTIFEMGFGSGLNAFLTAITAAKKQKAVQYISVEKFPLEQSETEKLLQSPLFEKNEDFELMSALHKAGWNREETIASYFKISKIHADLSAVLLRAGVHLVYFDAFDAVEQPELWTAEVFEKIFNSMVSGGILVTYSSKSEVRRNMQRAGFTTQKIPGPPGKREITRAYKP